MKFPIFLSHLDYPGNIECDNGWYKIIKEVCIVGEHYDSIHSNKVVACYIGEKFGILFMYTDRSITSIDETIEKATIESLHTCSHCGESGELRDLGTWRKTLCNKCLKRR